MIFSLDPYGQVLADDCVEQYIDCKLASGEDIRVANLLALECMLDRLESMPQGSRPSVDWWVHGKRVSNDVYGLGSFWVDPKVNLSLAYSVRMMS